MTWKLPEPIPIHLHEDVVSWLEDKGIRIVCVVVVHHMG